MHHLSASPADDDLGQADDAQLIAFTRDGRVTAFAELYRRHSYPATLLARDLGHREDSEDVVGEAFARIFALLHEGKGPDGSFRSYLYAAVRAESRRRFKTDDRVCSTEDDSVAEQLVELGTGRVEAFEEPAVRAALDSLPERWRSVLWAVEIDGRKPQEIAAQLGLTANGVSALVYRARSGLREAYLAQHLNPADGVPHQEIRTSFVPVLRGTASSRERAAVKAHLVTCDACQGVYRELEEDAAGMP